MSGTEPTKKKRLVLNAKFASELKTELVAEAAGTERAGAAVTVAQVSPAAVQKREEKPSPAPVGVRVAVARMPKEKEEEDWMDFDDDVEPVAPLLGALSVAEEGGEEPLMPFDRPIVFQLGSDALEGPAKLVRYQSGAMALVVGEKRYMLERGLPPDGNNQLVGRLSVATRELVVAANANFGRELVLTSTVAPHSDS